MSDTNRVGTSIRLRIHLENCKGIKTFDEIFKFSRSNSVHVIYASNGSMKTSLATTLRNYSESNETQLNLLWSNEPQVRDILIEEKIISPDRIFVADAEQVDKNFETYMTNFLADKGLKQQYDTIIQELDNEKKAFLKEFKALSKSTNVENEIVQFFGLKRNGFFDALIQMQKMQKMGEVYRAEFKFNNIFDPDGKVKEFLEQNTALLEQYIKRYNELLEVSEFYSKDAKFGTYQASELQRVLSDDAFFKAKHSLNLSGRKEIKNIGELKTLLQDEQNNILSDVKLKKQFEKIEKTLNKNKELRAFKEELIAQPQILLELGSYNNFAQKVLVGYFSQISSSSALVKLYLEKKKDIDSIIEKAKQQQDKWQKILELYKSRFFVPFDMKIENTQNAVLNLEVPSITFVYGDSGYPFKENDDLLSKGERRAFCILHTLFEIEEKKRSNEPLFIIYDDVADSFDYHNKHAIIEYINDISLETAQGSQNIYQIILTHNFDFYRTVYSRLQLDRNQTHMTKRTSDGDISLYQGQYVKNFASSVLGEVRDLDSLKSKVNFLAFIPFLRNLIEFRKNGKKSDDYELLTSCLHNKTKNPSVEQIIKIYSDFGYEISDSGLSREKVRSLIENTADLLVKNIDHEDNDLPFKFVLAMAIRLNLENYLINQLHCDTDLIKTNQTMELIKKFKDRYPNEYNKLSVLINKVQIMTPEYIHVNTFMYEPLVDTSVEHLLSLYQDCLIQLKD